MSSLMRLLLAALAASASCRVAQARTLPTGEGIGENHQGASNVDVLLERRAKLQGELAVIKSRLALLGSERSKENAPCLTVGPDTRDAKACWDAVKWASEDGIFSHPNWYPGLSAQSSKADFQRQMAQRGQNDCPMPCTTACATVGPDSGKSECWDAMKWATESHGIRDNPGWFEGLSPTSTLSDVQGWMAARNQHDCPPPCQTDSKEVKCQASIKAISQKCWKQVEWAAAEGIHKQPELFPNLSSSSNYVDFIDHFAKTNKGSDCRMPACDCVTVGPKVPGKCWDAVQWAAFTGIMEHREWLPGLTKDSAYASFQAFFARSGQNECPWPCPEGPPKLGEEKLPWTDDTMTCQSDLNLGRVVKSESKGMALDDTTLQHCPDEIPRLWPHTSEKVTSIRLFKTSVPGGNNEKAWKALAALAKANGIKFLLGTPVTCFPKDDEREWQSVLRFVDFVGKEHILGLAIGNEMDLLYKKPVFARTPGCLRKLWTQHGYLKTFIRRVEEWDKVTGLVDVPVTAVFAMEAIGGDPFLNLKGKAEVLPFLQGALRKYSTRFVFSINLYPYFSHTLGAAGCQDAAAVGTKFSLDEPAGFTPNAVTVLRQRMKAMNAANAKLWVGETGWAAPRAGYCALGCYEACASLDTFKNFYSNFLKWDMDAGADGKADHVFYFTIRDSSQFGSSESFGLIKKCGDRRCKLQ